MNILATSNQPLTMTSIEFLDAVINPSRLEANQSEVRYSDFMARVQDELDLSHDEIFVMNSTGGRTKKYANLDYDQMTLVGMRESKAVRKKVLEKLKSIANPALPTTKELALMVIKAEEEKEAAMLEVDRLQGVCNTITAQFASGTTTTAFAKQLNGVNVQQVNNKLLSMGVLIKTVNGFEPSSYYRDRYFKLSFHEYKDSEENDRRKSKITLTKAGAKWLYRAYLSNKLPMKKTWDGKFVHMIFE